MAGTLWTALDAIEDRLTKKGRRFPLPAIVLIALTAILREGKTPDGNEVRTVIKHLVARIYQHGSVRQ